MGSPLASLRCSHNLLILSVMALLPILHYPDPRLHTVAKPVTQVDERIRQLVDDMLETMYDAKGVGLAATQIDVHERVVVNVARFDARVQAKAK